LKSDIKRSPREDSKTKGERDGQAVHLLRYASLEKNSSAGREERGKKSKVKKRRKHGKRTPPRQSERGGHLWEGGKKEKLVVCG